MNFGNSHNTHSIVRHTFNESSGWFLITAATYGHFRYFGQSAMRHQLYEELLKELKAADIKCTGWTILPNHYHLLIKCDELSSLPNLIARVHGRSSLRLNKKENKSGRRIWYRHSDRQIRNERHYFVTLNYIHANPVKHKLVLDPLAWDTSSVHWYFEHFGSDWLQQLWIEFPVRSYGEKWDVF